MTFSEYYEQIQLSAFPEGEAENLVLSHKNAVRDALIDLQTKVPCLRTDHADYIGQSSTRFHCGASVFDSVDGNIERVYTLSLENGCQLVEYSYIDFARMQDLLNAYKCCKASDAEGMAPVSEYGGVGAPEYPAGEDTQDKGYRAYSGDAYWTVHRGQIYVFPSIESTEQIVVEWNGTRRTWQDDTVMPETMVEQLEDSSEVLVRDVAQAVEFYLDSEVHRRETKDMASFQVSSKMYSDAVAMLIYECRKQRFPVRESKAEAPDAC